MLLSELWQVIKVEIWAFICTWSEHIRLEHIPDRDNKDALWSKERIIKYVMSTFKGIIWRYFRRQKANWRTQDTSRFCPEVHLDYWAGRFVGGKSSCISDGTRLCPMWLVFSVVGFRSNQWTCIICMATHLLLLPSSPNCKSLHGSSITALSRLPRADRICSERAA